MMMINIINQKYLNLDCEDLSNKFSILKDKTFFVKILLAGVLFVFILQFYKSVKQDQNYQIIIRMNEEDRNNNSIKENEFKISSTNYSKTITRNKQRLKLLKEVCRKILNKTENRDIPIKSYGYLINEKYKVVYCTVFKSASSSWLYNFNLLAGYSKDYVEMHKHELMELIRKKYLPPFLQEVKRATEQYTSFLIVRHPFERLVSGYKDKLECARDDNAAYETLRSIIKERFGTVSHNEEDYLRKCKTGPTFKQFISYLIELAAINRFNVHWYPVSSFCTPCYFNYDLIAHVETLQEDADYLIHYAKLDNVIKPRWIHKSYTDTRNETKLYFSKLTKKQISNLYNIYKQDFELFGYSVNEYLPLGT